MNKKLFYSILIGLLIIICTILLFIYKDNSFNNVNLESEENAGQLNSYDSNLDENLGQLYNEDGTIFKND